MRKNIIYVFLLASMIILSSMSVLTVGAQEKTVKIGYDSNSNFIQEKNEEYYGYGVEYLKKISEYTDWEYEYVNDESWQESFEKLRNGEIDLICTVHYTNELTLKYGLEPKDLDLEITESLCGEEPGLIYDKLRQLQSLGFKIAMDDFGSGYSSLNMLKEMPLDIIKMDLKFLDGEEKKSQLILKSLINKARAMELKVVVEGVENLSQVEFLAQFKECSLQGYYFSRPVGVSEFEYMLENE